MECIWQVGVVCKEGVVNSTYFYWIAGGFLMVISEFFVPGIFIIFLGLGSIFTGVIVFISPIAFSTQVLVWAISSGCIILAGSQIFKNIFPSDQKVDESSGKDDYIGKIVTVVKKVEVSQRGGRVQLQGTEWEAMALSNPLEVGEKGRVYDRDNLTLLIEKISQDS